MQEWSGVRVLGQISLYTKRGDCLAEESGELQMVSYGLSGIPVFQVSRYAARALEEGQKPYLVMDIMTAYSLQEVTEEIFCRQQSFPKWTGVDALDGMLHRKLAKVLLKSLGMDAGQGIGKWTTKQVEKVAERMKSWKLGIDAVSGFDKAQVTCGGVLTNQIDAHTMEVKTCPGLYITGELLDVDGICGGYNLQWAWTSGYLAGKSAASGSNS
jgi:predicted Rossmann fold flavoprotein